MIQIKYRWNSERVVFESTSATATRDAVAEAVQGGANLRDADLRDADLGDANLGCADLRGADLRGADLRGANLRGADLRGADLGDANLGGANLRDANLRGADLGDANLGCADLGDANLGGANLRDANLGGANLRDANLRGADLRGADLRGADLGDANLGGAKMSDLQAARLSIVPESGAFCGWKKCRNGVLVRVEIPTDARRSNSTGRKCRAERVRVLEVIGADVGISKHDDQVTYRAGETVECDQWCEDRWQECAGGIHFFLTRVEAEEY